MLKRLALLLLLAVSPASAEEGADASETTERFGAWTVRCIDRQGTEAKACEVVVAIQGQAGLFAQVALGRPGGTREMLMVVRTPLGVMVSQPVTVTPQGDGNTAVELAFVTCLADGCIAQATVAGDWLTKLTKQETAIIGFAERTGRKITIKIPIPDLAGALSRIGLDCGSGNCVPAE
jgi:invasion protein IalB